ncbi:protein kinase [Prauserella oleivorans]|uniref:non-specific serine/threonine protein kinase n=1 Tax=Prauserella oleivorans TaxID=1478153 RepID=A0ABW5W729_9PSEU
MTRRKVINGRYELEPMPLARGGMGEVWVGHDAKLDREVVVKFVRFQDGIPDDELVRRFVRESRITARLQHPGVPAVFDVGTEDGRPFLVMQRVHGISLSDLIAQQEQLPVGWAAAIAAQACAVLAVAHDASLVHRDLKPANLILEPDGTVKVLDFGLAVALDLGDRSRITRTGQSIGTPAYMAPEQVLAAMSGPQTDLYALGCTLYEMLTGRPVFTGATSYTVMNKQVDEVPASAREKRPEIPSGLDVVLRALLEKKPENRPSSAHEAYTRLLPYATDLGPLPGVLKPPTVPSPVRMYATVLSRTFVSIPEPTQPAPSTVPHPTTQPPEPTRPPRTHISRDELEETRAEADELARQARYKEAAQALATVAEAAAERLGEKDPDVLAVRLELANILFEGGDYRAAAPAYAALADDLATTNGPDTELVFRCRSQQAECEAKLGNTAVALDIAQKLVADEQRVYGPRDPRPIELRHQIGLWQLSAGRRHHADRTLRNLLDDLIRHYGGRHPLVPRIRDVLSDLPG